METKIKTGKNKIKWLALLAIVVLVVVVVMILFKTNNESDVYKIKVESSITKVLSHVAVIDMEGNILEEIAVPSYKPGKMGLGKFEVAKSKLSAEKIYLLRVVYNEKEYAEPIIENLEEKASNIVVSVKKSDMHSGIDILVKKNN